MQPWENVKSTKLSGIAWKHRPATTEDKYLLTSVLIQHNRHSDAWNMLSINNFENDKMKLSVNWFGG